MRPLVAERLSSNIPVAQQIQKGEPGSKRVLYRSGEKMNNHVYKVIEIVGTSETSCDDAIKTAVAEASKTIRNMDWFEVVQTRGHLKEGKVAHYQVTLKIGFHLETK